LLLEVVEVYQQMGIRMSRKQEAEQPRGTRALARRILAALEPVPPTHRKLVFHHAVEMVRETLITQAEKAKVAVRKTGPNSAAKQTAAASAIATADPIVPPVVQQQIQRRSATRPQR
jgi:hypothetical protein